MEENIPCHVAPTEPSPNTLFAGCLLLENPVTTLSLCSNDGSVPWFSTRLRAAQARLFSLKTGDYYQHAIQYIGDGKIIHTRHGKVGIDSLSEMPPNFLQG